MSVLTNIGLRWSQVLGDVDDRIAAAYYYTQLSIDQIERPCFVIFAEDASFSNETMNQELYEQGYSIAYIGQIFSTAYTDFHIQFEEMTREIADNTVKYLFEHPQLQVSNNRGLLEDKLSGLAGVQNLRVDSRSAVTLYNRDAVEGDSFWGFTIDCTLKVQMAYETVGF